MSWIEGIGDEVTVLLIILLIFLITSVAWLSTGIRDIPFIRVIVVQLQQRRRHHVAAQEETNDPLIRRDTEETEGDLSGTEETVDQENVYNDNHAGIGEQVGSEIDVQSAGDSEQVSEIGRKQSVDSPNVEDHVHVSHEGKDEADHITSSDSENLGNDTIDTESSIEHIPSPELRHRRLMFFSGAKPHSSDSEQCLETPVQAQEENCESCNNTRTSQPDGANTVHSLPRDSNQQDISISNTEQTGSHHSSSIHASSETETDTQTGTGRGSGTSGEIHVKLKYLNETQRLVTSLPTETIGNFRQKHFSSELSESKLVRFIFNGQDLRNDASTLQACNIMNNSVVHCLVTQPRQQPTNNNNNQDDNLFDIGIFMLPLFGILLGIVWYMRFMYRQFFNVTSTMTLCGITFLYIAAFMSTLRGRRPHEHVE